MPSFPLPLQYPTFAGMADFEKLNRSVAGWAETQKRKMILAVGALTLKDRRALQKSAWLKANDKEYKPLAKSIGFALKEDFGQVSRVNFRLVRHGIFFERGVGRGRKASGGKTTPHPFIKPVLDPAIDQLADIIASEYADSAVGEIKFIVPGILSRRVKIISNG